MDLAAASLCLPPSSDKEPVPGAATDGHPSGSGVHLASFGMYAFQPHHPIPQPLPFVFAIPCGASPGMSASICSSLLVWVHATHGTDCGRRALLLPHHQIHSLPPTAAGMLPAYYHWAPLPSHLPTIIYAHAPAPGPGALPIVSFGPGPFPSQHVVAPYPNDWNNNWGMGGGHRGGGGYGYNSYRGHSNPFRRPSHHQQQHGAAQHCHSPRQHQQQTGAGAGAGMQRQRAGRNGEAPRLQRPNQRAYRQQQHRQHHQEEKDGRTMMDEGGTEA